MTKSLNDQTVKVGDKFQYQGEIYEVTQVGSAGVTMSDGYSYSWQGLAYMKPI